MPTRRGQRQLYLLRGANLTLHSILITTNYQTDLQWILRKQCELQAFGLAQGPMASSSEHDKDP
jgi:hypothetical protein